MVRLRHFDVFWFIFLFLCSDQVLYFGKDFSSFSCLSVNENVFVSNKK